eukprot:3584793-Pyramimonas_sp.AAC.1
MPCPGPRSPRCRRFSIRRGPAEPRAWTFVTCNVTERSGLDIFLSSPLASADVLAVQETHVTDTDALEAQLRAQGRRARCFPAVPTGRGGSSGGLVISTPKHMGLSQVHGISDVLEPGRAGPLHCGYIIPGVFWLPVYTCIAGLV